jgi:hypothetical protein
VRVLPDASWSAGVSPCLCVVWCPCRLGCDRWQLYFRCGNVVRAVSWCTVHLVMSSCGVTVTSLSLCIFNCGLPSYDQFREFSGCGTWLFSPYYLLRGVTVFTYFRGEYVLWSPKNSFTNMLF